MDGIVLSCEHAGNEVPRRYREIFAGRRVLLESHRGWDPGARDLALHLARSLRVPLHLVTVTRLLVDANRSEGNAGLFSRWTSDLPPDEQERILERHHRPHHRSVEVAVRAALARTTGSVLHLSLHSFTPVLRGVRRQNDLGLLYDPARSRERRFCQRWGRRLRSLLPSRLVVRMNQPYSGASDSLTTLLRHRLADERYLGIELEVNQRLVRASPASWQRLQGLLAESLQASLE